MQNAYERIAAAHAKDPYTRGINKGDAPMEGRAKAHFRIVRNLDTYSVRFHETDIVTFCQDGTAVMDCDGWYERPTTKAAVNLALGRFTRMAIGIQRSPVQGLRQNVYYAPQHRGYVYYDGMRIDAATGEVVSEKKGFDARRICKEDVVALTAGMKESGFKDMFKVLWAVVQPPTAPAHPYPIGAVSDVITTDYLSDRWTEVVQKYAYNYEWKRGQGGLSLHGTKRTAAATWSAIMAECKKPMYGTVHTDVTAI